MNNTFFNDYGDTIAPGFESFVHSAINYFNKGGNVEPEPGPGPEPEPEELVVTPPDYIFNCLRFTTYDTEGATIQLVVRGNEFVGHITPGKFIYSLDEGETWHNVVFDTDTEDYEEDYYSNTINLGDGESVIFSGDNSTLASYSEEGVSYHNFVIGGEVSASDDVTSLLNGYGGDEYLSEDCFYALFKNCTSLVNAPNLPSYELGVRCYSEMFYGCTSLATAPSLRATELAQGCYRSMFYGCTSLQTAPVLPAKELVNGCYVWMFANCESLNTVTANFTTNPKYYDESLDEYNYRYTGEWLDGVDSVGTFICSSDVTWVDDYTPGSSTIPEGWTVVKPIPNITEVTTATGETGTSVQVTFDNPLSSIYEIGELYIGDMDAETDYYEPTVVIANNFVLDGTNETATGTLTRTVVEGDDDYVLLKLTNTITQETTYRGDVLTFTN